MIPEGYDPAGDLLKMVEPLIATLHETHPGLAVETKIIEGHPAPVLINESHGADLLVVIGSTSEHCVANAACPVVVIRGNT
jgi:nucleotide-binding universal stress UspA family protein